MTRKSGKPSHARYGTLYNCFDLIWPHQQFIPGFPPLEIEPATAAFKNEILPLDHRSILHVSDAE